ncbi:MAG: hypothetical protein O2960_28685, partial [Verrucomicrobia bacterium]|nr:hypothetical protein [Verrucomicrobiota bacterium]
GQGSFRPTFAIACVFLPNFIYTTAGSFITRRKFLRFVILKPFISSRSLLEYTTAGSYIQRR